MTSSVPPVITIDTETDPIRDRPNYPPKPCGVAIKYPNEVGRYYAFGHKSENNCDVGTARIAVRKALATNLPVLFHHSKFDLEVLRIWGGFNDADFPWDRVHDTMWLAFLEDPHAQKLDLKGLAENYLGWKPEERDAMAEWAWAHREELYAATGVRVTRKKGLEQAANVFEFIPYIPGNIVAPYAVGDVERTHGLFNHFYPRIRDSGQLIAYDRERELQPIWLNNERDGIRADLDRLGTDVPKYRAAMELVEGRLRQRLDAPDLNFDADQDYAAALIRSGLVAETSFARTAKRGDYKVGKDTLTPDMFTDYVDGYSPTASVIGYRNRLKTCLSMFMEKWLEQASQNRGRISTTWNSTRGGDGGTRTGRPSTSGAFNLLNISKDFENRGDKYVHPHFLQVPPLPLVREYALPDEGCTWLHRDFSGQELRVFAHYESGALLQAYQENPALDPHAWVRDIVVELAPYLLDGVASEEELEDRLKKLRTTFKVINFQSLYGGGLDAIVRVMKVAREEAIKFKDFHNKALPGRRILNDAITLRARMGQPIVTWGGRCYYPEEPLMKDGRLIDFIYKLINYLIQGSAADITKQALIDWHNHPKREGRFLVTVYDEINTSCPIDLKVPQMALLRDVMCLPRLDCPMLSDGKWGPNWGKLETCD